MRLKGIKVSSVGKAVMRRETGSWVGQRIGSWRMEKTEGCSRKKFGIVDRSRGD